MKINKNVLSIIILYIFLIICLNYAPKLFIIGLISIFISYCIYIYTKSLLINDSKTISFIVALPIFMSCFQNVYLGAAINNINAFILQIALTINIIIMWGCIIASLLIKKTKVKNRTYLILCIVIIIQAIFMSFIYNSPILAFISSLRNILSPISIMLFALNSIEKCDKNSLFKYLTIEIILVVAIGFFEYFIGNTFWIKLNIARLWKLKGLDIGKRSVPGNFYSSELINGHQLRRMTSSFADPVNLGSFLYAAFVILWYERKKKLSFIIIICCILTVSKAALLGFIIFIALYGIIVKKNELIKIIAIISAITIGISFYMYSQTSSYGSMNFHINGFIASLKNIFEYPLGQGVGNVGVLASKMGSEAALNTDIFETGIGMIIGQLGIVGLFVYFIFFKKILLIPLINKWKDKKDIAFFYSIIISYVLNMIFNEVALSPNSCALYFIMTAILINNSNEKNEQNTLKKENNYIYIH